MSDSRSCYIIYVVLCYIVKKALALYIINMTILHFEMYVCLICCNYESAIFLCLVTVVIIIILAINNVINMFQK